MIATTPAEEAVPTPAPAGPAVDEQLRLARADIARLKLELRALLRKAEAAEQASTAEPRSNDPLDVDLAAARELLASSLGHHLDARRRELAAELEAARAEAARLVEAAHKRAEEYVAEAHDMVFGALLHPDQVVDPLPPLPLEVVPDTGPASAVLAEEPTVPVAIADGSIGPVAMAAALQAYLAGTASAVPTAIARTATPRRPRPALRARLLHLDVILPIIAIVAVLLILLAWVG